MAIHIAEGKNTPFSVNISQKHATAKQAVATMGDRMTGMASIFVNPARSPSVTSNASRKKNTSENTPCSAKRNVTAVVITPEIISSAARKSEIMPVVNKSHADCFIGHLPVGLRFRAHVGALLNSEYNSTIFS